MSNKKINIPRQKPESNAMPSIGEEANAEYLKMFYPKPEQGMKWTYSMSINIQGMALNAELIMEVIEVKNKKVIIKTTMGDQSFDSETSVDAFSPIPSASGGAGVVKSGYTFEGYEDIITSVGEFKGCSKLSSVNEGNKSYLWLHKGTGPVRFLITSNGVPADLVLSEFKN